MCAPPAYLIRDLRSGVSPPPPRLTNATDKNLVRWSLQRQQHRVLGLTKILMPVVAKARDSCLAATDKLQRPQWLGTVPANHPVSRWFATNRDSDRRPRGDPSGPCVFDRPSNTLTRARTRVSESPPNERWSDFYTGLGGSVWTADVRHGLGDRPPEVYEPATSGHHTCNTPRTKNHLFRFSADSSNPGIGREVFRVPGALPNTSNCSRCPAPAKLPAGTSEAALR